MSKTEIDLNEILNIKSNLYYSILGKGVDIQAGTPLEEYPSKIASIKSDGTAVILKIIPSPADATVTFEGKTNFLNQTACIEGGTVTYTVSKAGYTTVSSSEVVNSSKSISVTLNAE